MISKRARNEILVSFWVANDGMDVNINLVDEQLTRMETDEYGGR